MRRSLNRVFVHFVWATWDRLPMLTPAIEQRVYAAILAKCEELKSPALAIGGVEDHVHLVVRLHPTVAFANLVKEVKGSTSHLVTHGGPGETVFKWQGSYGAFSVSHQELERVVAYVRNQKDHHSSGTSESEWESTEESD